MRATSGWTKQTELELLGILPFGLDGLLLMPTIDPSDGGLLMHALRLSAQASLWFGSIAPMPAPPERAPTRGLSFSRTLGQGREGRRLSVRQRGDAVSWSLRDLEGSAQAKGCLRPEQGCRIVDLSVTRSSVVVLGVEGEPQLPRYQVGVAPRGEHASVRWLSRGQRGYPELLLAREHADALQVELAVRATEEPGAARLMAWSLHPHEGAASARARLDCAVLGPTVWADPRGEAGFLCAVTAQSFAGESAPVLIKLDLVTGDRETRSFGFARELGAPSIAEVRTQGESGGRVFVLLPIYDAVRDCTECHALAADDLHAPALAVVRLPEVLRATRRTQWVSAGRFHALDEALDGLTRGLAVR
ncbi:MAG: hypothetical protein ABW252_15710 [Polyangiales bacterium]